MKVSDPLGFYLFLIGRPVAWLSSHTLDHQSVISEMDMGW